MSKNKFITETQKKLRAYVNLSVRLQNATLVPGSYQPEIKNLALMKVQELKNKKDIIYFLKEYINSFIEEDKSNDFNFENQNKRQKYFFFLSYFLESVILKHGEDFLLVELLGKPPLNPKRGVIESCKKAVNGILSFLNIVKYTQKGMPENDDLFYSDFKKVLSSVEVRENIVNKDVLIKNEFFTWRLIYEMAKYLNPASLVGVKPEDGQTTTKDRTDINSDSGIDSDSVCSSHINAAKSNDADNHSLSKESDSTLRSKYNLHEDPLEEPKLRKKSDTNSKFDVGYDSDSDFSSLPFVNSVESNTSGNEPSERVSSDSSLDSDFASIHHSKFNLLESSDSDFSEELKSKQKVKRIKKRRSEAAERFYARQKNYDLRLKLEEKSKQKFQEKLKYCLERRNAYETLYKKYEIDKDNTHFSNEELKNYEFKFIINKELYDFYNYNIEKYFLNDKIKSSEKIKLYYEFKCSINQYKLDQYNSYIDGIENDIKSGKKVKIYTLKTLGYYKEKCKKIYIPRLKKYKLLIENKNKEINAVHIAAKNKLPVERVTEETFTKKNQLPLDRSQRQATDSSGIDTLVTSADENETTILTEQPTSSESSVQSAAQAEQSQDAEEVKNAVNTGQSLSETPPPEQSTSQTQDIQGGIDFAGVTSDTGDKNQTPSLESSVPQTEQDKSAKEVKDAVNTGKNPPPPPPSSAAQATDIEGGATGINQIPGSGSHKPLQFLDELLRMRAPLKTSPKSHLLTSRIEKDPFDPKREAGSLNPGASKLEQAMARELMKRELAVRGDDSDDNDNDNDNDSEWNDEVSENKVDKHKSCENNGL